MATGVLASWLLAACGASGEAPPQARADSGSPADTVPDAAPPDAACPCALQPLAERFSHAVSTTLAPDGVEAVASAPCAAGAIVGGSCTVEGGAAPHLASLAHLGPPYRDDAADPDTPPDNLSMCVYRSSGWEPSSSVVAAAVCLEDPPDDQQCGRTLDIEVRSRRDFAWRGTFGDLRVACPEGLLIGGGCTFNPGRDHDIDIVRSGFDPYRDFAWLCSWDHDSAVDGTQVTAVAFCLKEPELPAGPACSCCPPVDELIYRREARAALEPGLAQLQVRCEQGDTMLTGSCSSTGLMNYQIDDMDLYRNGFAGPERDIWECAWNNAMNATGRELIATAVCVRPGG